MDVDTEVWTPVVQSNGITRWETEPVSEAMNIADLFPQYSEQDKFIITKLIASTSVQGISSNIPGDNFSLNYDTPLPDEEKKYPDEDVLSIAKRVYGKMSTTDLEEEQRLANEHLKALQREQTMREEYVVYQFPDFKPDLSSGTAASVVNLNERNKVKRDKLEQDNHLNKRQRED